MTVLRVDAFGQPLRFCIAASRRLAAETRKEAGSLYGPSTTHAATVIQKKSTIDVPKTVTTTVRPALSGELN